MSNCFFDGRTNEFYCSICNVRWPVKLPMTIDAFVGLSKVFEREHRKCGKGKK